jgi:hypothetical protein
MVGVLEGRGGHLSRVKRRSEVLWAPQTLEKSACKNKQTDIFSAKRQSFERVRNAHKSYGWGGSVGRDRGKMHVQLGVGGFCVSFERRRTVNRAKTQDEEERGKKR